MSAADGNAPMLAAEREALILAAIQGSGFVAYRTLEDLLPASPATIRRDLARLEAAGRLTRVHGGARLDDGPSEPPQLAGTPFTESLGQNIASKRAIGAAAAGLCVPGEAVMIDGGTTTLQMCPHIAGLRLQVLTNSLPIVDALLPQEGTGLLVPSGAVFREQRIILAPAGEESMPRFHARKLFMGAAAVRAQGVMQRDPILVAAERRLIDRAEELILLVDSSKFAAAAGAVVCALDEIDVVVTDAGLPGEMRAALDAACIRTVIAT